MAEQKQLAKNQKPEKKTGSCVEPHSERREHIIEEELLHLVKR